MRAFTERCLKFNKYYIRKSNVTGYSVFFNNEKSCYLTYLKNSFDLF